MIMTYKEFTQKLNTKIMADQAFYNSLLIKVVSNPHRFTGIFRLSNVKNKLIQYVTQSREIRFGDFMEDIVTEYIRRMGYIVLDKRIKDFDKNKNYNIDQLFRKENNLFLVEQKIRDDHDSTKKTGQFDNFRKKYSLLRSIYPQHDIHASMWFIDDGLVKNKNYYLSEIARDKTINLKLSITYGQELFEQIFGNISAWEEICSYLSKNKAERNQEALDIPDFDTSTEMWIALVNLKEKRPTLFKKLISEDKNYVQLREELFPTGENLNRLIN